MTIARNDGGESGAQAIAGARTVCLVTSEFAPIDAAGDAALHFSALASLLAEAGIDVCVLYAGSIGPSATSPSVDRYDPAGVRFVPLPETGRPYKEQDLGRIAQQVYQWLKRRDFDVIHFLGDGALAYYAAAAKEQGLAFPNTTITVMPFFETRDQRRFGECLLDSHLRLKRELMESAVRDMADFRIACTRGRSAEKKHAVLDLPLLLPATPPPDDRVETVLDTVVFLTDLNISGGLERVVDTCRAIDPISGPRLVLTGRSFELPMYESDAETVVRNQVDHDNLTIEPNPSLADIIERATAPGTLVVLPNLHDTALYATRLCLDVGARFTGYATPGNLDLVDAGDTDALFDPRTPLTDLVRTCVANPPGIARPARPGTTDRDAWLTWHRRLEPPRPVAPAFVSADPLVSVCMATYERPRLLERALASLIRQDYSRIEIVVVDDGSPGDDTRRALERLESEYVRGRGRLLTIENSGPANARNEASRHANGDRLLFMDDDNVALAHEVSTFVAVSRRAPADILTCLSYISDTFDIGRLDPMTAKMLLPIGNFPDLALFECCMGDTNLFISPRTFSDLGGFPPGERDEDWEFLLRASFEGHSIRVVPEPLFVYHWHLESRARNGNRHAREMNRLALYRQYVRGSDTLLELAHGSTRGRGIASERKHVLLPMRARLDLAARRR